MRRSVAILVLLVGCSIEKPFSEADFPCSAGGLCIPDSGVVRDMGVRDEADAGFPDVDPGDVDQMDRPPVDMGPVIDCPSSIPLPASGGVSNASTIGETNDVEGNGACFDVGGRDIAYHFHLPGRVKSMTFVATNPTLATYVPALHLFRDTCQPNDQVVCGAGDDFDFMAVIRQRDLPPGDYAIVVDGINASSAGSFDLVVDGIVYAGEPCDPLRTSIRCEVGNCNGGACQKLFDCPDPSPIDADGDGMFDEDACDDAANTPPQVTCTASATAAPGQVVQLVGGAADDVMVLGRDWEMIAQPIGSRVRIENGNQNNVSFTVDLAGTYRARFRAYDDTYQTSACELVIDATPAADLYTETYWLDEPFDSFDMDIVLVHPDATTWYDPTLACTIDTACDTPPDWGTAGPDLNPANDPIWSGDSAANLIAAESVYVPSAQQTGNYGVGVHAFSGDPRQLFVNVYCRGSLVGTYSSTVPAIGDNFDEGDFWKVVDVQVGAGACTLTELGSVVTRAQAELAR